MAAIAPATITPETSQTKASGKLRKIYADKEERQSGAKRAFDATLFCTTLALESHPRIGNGAENGNN
jgi:hypothetical protein